MQLWQKKKHHIHKVLHIDDYELINNDPSSSIFEFSSFFKDVKHFEFLRCSINNFWAEDLSETTSQPYLLPSPDPTWRITIGLLLFYEA